MALAGTGICLAWLHDEEATYRREHDEYRRRERQLAKRTLIVVPAQAVGDTKEQQGVVGQSA